MQVKAVVHASELMTGAGIRKRDGRFPEDQDLGVIPDGALVYSLKGSGKKQSPDKILWVGPTSELPEKYKKASKKNLKNQQAVIPGLIDCHTHLVFAGDRSDEFAKRCAGATYEQIAQAGGGIWKTVLATRQASTEELKNLALARLEEAAALGVRSLEIKSGYGLSAEAEMKCLRVIQELREEFPEMTLHSTFLGAHDFPKGEPPEKYFRILLDEMLPMVSKEGLAESCDVFIDQGYYTLEQGRTLLQKAQSLGLKVRVHGEEFACTGAAELACELGALSVDHLLNVSESGIQALGRSGTVAVLLPGTAFYLKAQQAPARKLLKAGAKVALATDFNPGSCMCNHLPTIMTLAALYLGMTRAEIFAAVTYNAACALGLESRKGTLEVGRDADFFILPFQHFDEMYYRLAWLPLDR